MRGRKPAVLGSSRRQAATLLAVLLVTATGLLAPTASQAATAITGPPIRGTVTWTVVLQSHSDETYGYETKTNIVTTSTTTTTVTLHVALGRFANKKGIYTAVDNGSSTYDASSRGDGMKVTHNPDGTACTATTTGDIGGSGKFASWTSKDPVQLGASLLPYPHMPGHGPKSLMLDVPAPYAIGKGSYTEAGDGCQGLPAGVDQGGETEVPLWGDYLVENRPFYCVPAGLKPSTRLQPRQFIGAWHAESKSFVFDCSVTVPIKDGTAQMTVAGALRYG